jgi:DNA repair exonuclease SbcCD ATPase subunit
MFKSVHLTNFQGHENTTVEFDSGVTAIIGATDSGKSSVIRALRLVIENRPAGTSYIRTGTKLASVGLITDTDTIVRERSSTVNSYLLNDEPHSGFGQGVPDAVTDALKVDTEVNMQRQSSPYFLLHSTPPERGKLIDKFCNIATASQSVVVARRYALRADKEANEMTERLGPLEAQQEALQGFLAHRGTIDALEQQGGKLSDLGALLKQVTKLGGTLQDLNQKIPDKIGIPEIPDVIPLVTTCSRLKRSKESLAVAIPKRISYSEIPDINKPKSALAQLQVLKNKLNTVIPDAIDVGVFSVTDDYSKLSKMISACRSLQQRYSDTNSKIEETKQELLTAQEALTEWGICPLCQQRMEHKHD